MRWQRAYVRHRRHARRVPLADVGVERRPSLKSCGHNPHAAHVPIADVAVRRRRGRRVRDPRGHGRGDVGVCDGRLGIGSQEHQQRETGASLQRSEESGALRDGGSYLELRRRIVTGLPQASYTWIAACVLHHRNRGSHDRGGKDREEERHHTAKADERNEEPPHHG